MDMDNSQLYIKFVIMYAVSVSGGLHIFSSPIVGKLSDIYGRRKIMLLCYTLPCLGFICMGFSTSPILMALSRIPNGILGHGVSTAKAYLVDITDCDQRPSAIGYFDSIGHIGHIIGPLISGYLAFVDPTLRLSIFTGSGIVLLNLFNIYFFLPPSEKDQSDLGNEKLKQSVHCNWIKVCKTLDVTKGFNWRCMKDLLLIFMMIKMAAAVFHRNFPVFMECVFSVDNMALGELLSYNSFVTTLSSVLCGMLAKHYPNLFTHALPAIPFVFASLLFMAEASAVSHIVVGLSIFSAAMTFFNLCMVNLMLKRGRGDDEGAILGLSSSIGAVGNLLAPVLVGLVQEYDSRKNSYLAALLVLVAIVGICIQRLLDKCMSKPKLAYIQT